MHRVSLLIVPTGAGADRGGQRKCNTLSPGAKTGRGVLTIQCAKGREFLRGARQERRLTMGQLSIRADVNKATLSRWETGTTYPRIPELRRVLDALDATGGLYE